MHVWQNRIWRLAGGVLVLLVAATGITYLARPQVAPRTGASLQVVAAENFWGDIASQLGGRYVQVTAIITDPSTDPHLYESTAQNAAAISSADVVITNGLGYDEFADKLLSASPSSTRTVLTAADILHVGTGSNPHLWYDMPYVATVAAHITNSYIAKDPAHRSIYAHNLEAFNQSLQGPEAAAMRIKQRYSGTPVAYTEPVPAYQLAAAGLGIKTPPGFAKSIEDGNEPSPADAQAMDALITDKHIKVLLYNAQATSPITEHVKTLARQYGIPVVGVTETLPAGESYQTWQQNQLQQLLQALGG